MQRVNALCRNIWLLGKSESSVEPEVPKKNKTRNKTKQKCQEGGNYLEADAVIVISNVVPIPLGKPYL